MKLFTEAPGYLTIIKIQSSLINFSFQLSAFFLLHWVWEEISRVDCQVLRGPLSYYLIMPACSLLLYLFLLHPSKLCSDLLLYICTIFFQNMCFYFSNFQSLLFQLPEIGHLLHFNANNIIKETDNREYKKDGKYCKSEISIMHFQQWPECG